MSIPISNESQLKAYLEKKLMLALKDTMNELLDKLEEYISEDVYIAHTPTFYERTYEFMNSWRVYLSQQTDELWGEIYQDDSIMRYDPTMWQHGSWYSRRLPEEKLAEIINDGNIGDIANFPQLGERPFWNHFSEYCDINFNKIFQKHCAKYGIIGTF